MEKNRRRVDVLLRSEEVRQDALVAEQKRIRARLAAIAKQTEKRYQRDRQQLLPLANSRLQDTIKPWWQDFKEAGTSAKLLKWVNTENWFREEDVDVENDNNLVSIAISEPIIYPDGVSSLWEEGDRSVIRALKNGDQSDAKRLEEIYKKYASYEELRLALFEIKGKSWQSRYYEGLQLSRKTLTNEKSSDSIQLYAAQVDALSTKVHPEVLIDFAQQIKTGKVWEIIEGSIAQAKAPPITVSKGELEIEAKERAREYRRTKKDRYARYLSS